MDERLTKLTTSQVRCFKTCRKRYYLEYIEGLKPIETPTALKIGTLYHAGLERLLNGMTYADMECEIVELQRDSCDKRGIDYDELNTFIALEMIRAWNRDSNWHEWQVTSVEKTFEVSTGYAKRLIGKVDGTIMHDGKPYLIEHKTTSQWGTDGADYLHNLLWDEQSTNYLYAYSKMLEDGVIEGQAVEGVFYDIIEKPKNMRPFSATAPELRQYNKKTGELYKGQHDHDETPEEFRMRVRDWYNESKRVHSAFVYRTPADIREHIADFNLTMKDINVAEREGTWYRNPEACKILPCPYRAKCLENRPDTDCLFVRKTKTNEEL